jgi:SNF2 family DNA or RNA helicase
VKEDVEKSLPPKEEVIIEVALTTIQKQFYRAVYERNTTFLFKGSVWSQFYRPPRTNPFKLS